MANFKVTMKLQQLGEKNCTDIFRRLSGQFFAQFKLRMRRLHADTTTISFYGEYDLDETALSAEEREAALRIVRGYNKDGHPQCNQVAVGQIVNEDGVAVISEVLDGNTCDTDWNARAGRLRRRRPTRCFSRAASRTTSRERIRAGTG